MLPTVMLNLFPAQEIVKDYSKNRQQNNNKYPEERYHRSKLSVPGKYVKKNHSK